MKSFKTLRQFQQLLFSKWGRGSWQAISRRLRSDGTRIRGTTYSTTASEEARGPLQVFKMLANNSPPLKYCHHWELRLNGAGGAYTTILRSKFLVCSSIKGMIGFNNWHRRCSTWSPQSLGMRPLPRTEWHSRWLQDWQWGTWSAWLQLFL